MAIGEEYARGYALELLAPDLTDAQLTDALGAAKTIKDESARASRVSGLAEHLSRPQQREAFAAFLSVGDQVGRPNLLGQVRAFIPVISEVGGERALLGLRDAMRDTAIWYP
jgi:hypothetical protein